MAYEEVLKFKKNDVVFTEIESEKSMFLIKRGTVLLYRQTENNRIPVVTLKPGDWFGVPGFFLEVNRNICARAMSDATIIKVRNSGDIQLSHFRNRKL